MTSLVQKSHMVGEAVAKSSEGLACIRQKSQLISNHVDDANRIMRRMFAFVKRYQIQQI
jgi:pyridoxal biosynthesis lyase PdxS